MVLLIPGNQGAAGTSTENVNPRCGGMWEKVGKVAARLKGRVLATVLAGRCTHLASDIGFEREGLATERAR